MNQQQLEQIKQAAEATYSAFSANNMFKPALIEGFIDGASWMQGEGERQWISVKDRLPESNNVFLVVRQYGLGRQEIKCAFFRTDHNCFDDFLENIITHWMKLPEPPKPQTEQP